MLKISRIYVTWILFFICLILYVLRRPDMILNPQPWAEDGAIFINDHLTKGLAGVFHNYAGYLHLFPRFFTIVSVELSELLGMGLQLSPLFMNTLAIITSVLCVLYLLSPTFDWLSSYNARALSVIAIILIPTIPEVYGNVTNVNWWLGIFQFLVILHIWKWKEYPSLLVTSLFLLSGLSGPMIIVPAFMIFLVLAIKFNIEHRLSKRTIAFGLATFIVALVQINLSLSNRQISTENSPDLHGFLIYFPRTFFVGLFDRIFLWNFQEVVRFVLMPTAVLLGVVILLLLTYINFNRIKLLLFSMTYIFLLMVITFIGANTVFGLYIDPFTDLGQRYFFVPVSILIILLFTSACKIRLAKTIHYFMCAVASINLLINYQHDPYIDYDWRNAVKAYNAKSTNSCEIAINPPGWRVNIPCE